MEKKEFEILSIRIRPKLLSVARNFALVSGIEADDVVQEALIALWELVEQDYSLKNIDSLAIRIRAQKRSVQCECGALSA